MSMVPDKAVGRPFLWCPTLLCMNVSAMKMSSVTRTWVFNNSAHAFDAPFTPLGSGQRWQGWMWMSREYARHSAAVAARSGPKALLVMLDSADMVMQQSWSHLVKTFFEVSQGKPLVMALETGCPAGAATAPGSSGRCVPGPPNLLRARGDGSAMSGIQNLRNINGGFVMGHAWAMEKLWSAVARNERKISCCHHGQLNPQLGMGRFAHMYPEMVALDVEQRLCALINFKCNAAGMCSGVSKGRHNLVGADRLNVEKSEFKMNYEVLDATPSERPQRHARRYTRRVCNRHSGVCPALIHIPGQTFGGPKSIYWTCAASPPSAPVTLHCAVTVSLVWPRLDTCQASHPTSSCFCFCFAASSSRPSSRRSSIGSPGPIASSSRRTGYRSFSLSARST